MWYMILMPHGTDKTTNMSRLINIATSTLLSGGIIGHGTLGGYISDSVRRALGLGLAEFQDGQAQQEEDDGYCCDQYGEHR